MSYKLKFQASLPPTNRFDLKNSFTMQAEHLYPGPFQWGIK